MVFQDYEIIHTKRVAHDRRGTDIYKKRFHNARGGYIPFYYALLFGIFGYKFGEITKCEIVPTI
jgi:hypothetical protein